MFELSVACKYLIPRRRQLSVSIISLISILVISLVVWLIVVFFSVTDGLEKSWVQKLTALTAPVRIMPKEAYYQSYYYNIDSISESSGYTPKTIGEKRSSSLTNPYDPDIDEETPAYWPAPDRDANGELKDLVKLVYQSVDDLKGVPGLKAQDFELSFSHLYLQLTRDLSTLPYSRQAGSTRSALNYPTYLGQFEANNVKLNQTLLPIRLEDINNLLSLLGTAEKFDQDSNTTDEVYSFDAATVQKRLMSFFQAIQVQKLKTRASGWPLPRLLWPAQADWTVIAIVRNDRIARLIIPTNSQDTFLIQQDLEEQNIQSTVGRLQIETSTLTLTLPSQPALKISAKTPLIVAAGIAFPVELISSSLSQAKKVGDILFHANVSIQGTSLEGIIPFRGLELAEIKDQGDLNQALWVHHTSDGLFTLPRDADVGDGVLLPKSFKDVGVLVGDRGYLTYVTPTTSTLQEQRLPIYVAGFYDPGIIPIGGKFILANRDVTSLIRSAHQDEKVMTNGINIRFDHLDQAEEVKERLQKAFKAKGIDRYWTIETYREYEFTRGIIQELQSQKNLFTLIAIVIILVACSNIISMLVILVNDKKVEIGILRSMGASSKSIALIFGLAGGVIGMIGSLVGISAAILTLRYLDVLIGFISRIQGHQMLNAAFYGDVLPQELSYEALSFVLGATMVISLLAGIVPAVKACLVRPSSILRSAGG